MSTAWGYALKPPPTEKLAVAYWGPLMAPLPVTTRQAKPAAYADTVDPYLRVEAAGGFMRNDEFLYDVSVILHSYAPQDLATTAEDNMETALGWGERAYNTTVIVDGVDWWIAHSWVTANSFRQNDPLVNMVRYRGMVTWRVPGAAVVAPGRAGAGFTGAGTLAAGAVAGRRVNSGKKAVSVKKLVS